MSSPKTIAFFGASAGCGLHALKHAVAAGHTCIALCRAPAKLEAQFPEKPANLILKAGNAHDVAAVSACLTAPSDAARLVDTICFSIGAKLIASKLTTDDPDVCKKGIAAVFVSMANLRAHGAHGRPLLVVVSTTGISKFQRDVPLAFLPMYHYMLKVPHADKKVVEEQLVASGERIVMVRPSLLVDGAKPGKKIRVGIEDPRRGVEVKEVGYTISREDVGRWIYENLLVGDASRYEGKAVGLTW